MKAKFARLRLAALVGIAWTSACAADPYRTFTLTWTSPTQNEDGSPLIDLQGYYVYVGQSPEALWRVYFTGAQSIVLGHTGFGPGYFAVSAVNTSGVESARTEVLSEPVEVLE
jgi:hypothetical protein